MCESDALKIWVSNYKKEFLSYWYPTAFAKHPVIVLFTISYIVLGLSYGITFLSVTVNPIEIWAAPDSRSRIEKDYFDNRFQPFYRSEQIYIKSVGLDKVSCCIIIMLVIYFQYLGISPNIQNKYFWKIILI